MGLFDIFKKNKEDNIQLLEQQMDQKLFNELQKYLPNNWQEVIFFAGYYKEDSAYFKYWVKTEIGKYIDCFELIPPPQNGKKDILQEQLMNFHNEIKFVRNKLSKKHQWSIMVMKINNKGKMSKDYDYADNCPKEKLEEYVENYKNELNKKFS